MPNINTSEDFFDTIAEFKEYLYTRGEIGLSRNDKHYVFIRYGGSGNDYTYCVAEVPQKADDEGAHYSSLDELLNHQISGKKLREIITEMPIDFV